MGDPGLCARLLPFDWAENVRTGRGLEGAARTRDEEDELELDDEITLVFREREASEWWGETGEGARELLLVGLSLGWTRILEGIVADEEMVRVLGCAMQNAGEIIV